MQPLPEISNGFYKATPSGLTPNLSSSEDTVVIEYTRGQALREGAIVPLHFEWGDGEAKWIDEQGQECSVESLAEAGDYRGIALRTALSTGYAEQLLTKCVDNWKSHKQKNHRSKLLVLAPSIATANQYLEWLKKLQIKALKATSDESKEAQVAIKRFKKHYNYGDAKAVDALVTVAMAYEGLDVPAITHVACLTNIRSKPWLEQSWARAARVDREAGNLKKTGLIYLPDDQLATKCVQDIIAEQGPIIRERELNRRDNGNGGTGDNDAKSNDRRYNSSIALNSSLTRSRASDLSSGETVDYAETAQIQSAMQKVGLGGISTVQMKRFLDAYQEPEAKHSHDSLIGSKESLTPSEERDIIREKLEKYVRYYAARNRIESKTINQEIVKQFGKGRAAMTLEELRQVWAWLQSKYPMND